MKQIISIESSFIKSAVYNDKKQSLRLEIGENWYYYLGVTRQKVSRFKNAVSKGTYFSRFIKNRYECFRRKIR